MNRKTLILYAGLLLMLTPFQGSAEPTAEELEQNRRKLSEWRRHPENYQHLRKEADTFFALPDEQQQRILRLDHELHDEPAARQARLHNVMDRYVEWLDKLDDKDRQRIKSAPDKNARLAIIQELRDADWMKYRPKAQRERYLALQGDAKTEFIKALRQDERQRRQEWLIAARFWNDLEKKTPLPSRLTDYTGEVITYVNEYLMPMLSDKEKDRLAKAQGKWPTYPLTLVELADAHPPALPGPDGPKSFAELPNEVQKRFKTKVGAGAPKKLNDAKKHWPEFAIAVTSYAASNKKIVTPFPHELWPWNRSCLSPQMQEFLANKLTKVLDNQEMLRLIDAEAKARWPEYPLTIKELADNHNLHVPWQTLPGKGWDNYRNLRTGGIQGLPEVAEQNLRQFVLFGLTPKERDDLKYNPNDPASVERLHHAYFQHYPIELKRLLQKNQKRARERPAMTMNPDKLD